MDDIKSVTELQVCKSANGYYIGTMCTVEYDGCCRQEEPYSRDSQEYYPTKEDAQYALDNDTYTPKMYP
jgi:hypothetical protein